MSDRFTPGIIEVRSPGTNCRETGCNNLQPTTYIEQAMVGSGTPPSLCIQRRPSDSINSMARFGPQEPGTYSCGGFFDSAQPFSMGSITAQAASTSSPRIKSV